VDKAKPFEGYFNDEHLAPEKLEWLRLTRRLVHEIYPDAVERVSYAMPGFYPKDAKKATHQLFLIMANAKWLGLYGTPGLDETVKPYVKYGVSTTKGSIHVPYDMPVDAYRKMLTDIIDFNLTRHGFESLNR
jgi:uncharacterized protein YdhG (YjbR/CyaY superfamily)